MNVFFMGATKFSYRCLQATLRAGCRVVGCAGTPEVFQISYAPRGVRNVNYFDFFKAARDLGLTCIPYQRDNVADFVRQVKPLEPDLILVAGWYYMVPKSLRAVAPKGALGLHGSLLPKFRGGAPLVWTMIHGEKVGGLSLFYLEDGVDTGDVVGQEAFAIEDHETIAHALAKMEDAAEKLILTYLPLLAQDRAPRIKQDHTQATQFPQRNPADGEIDWSKSPAEIRNFIRAQAKPYPGAFTRIGDKKVVIWDADVIEEAQAGETERRAG
jgi:methionyl-tRNA formyltransferase